jgi:hypothetical protein
MAAMTHHEPRTRHLPDKPCHRTREHVPHVIYEGQTAVGWCPGVGDLFPPEQLATPDDPFAGIDTPDDYDSTRPAVSE